MCRCLCVCGYLRVLVGACLMPVYIICLMPISGALASYRVILCGATVTHVPRCMHSQQAVPVHLPLTVPWMVRCPLQVWAGSHDRWQPPTTTQSHDVTSLRQHRQQHTPRHATRCLRQAMQVRNMTWHISSDSLLPLFTMFTMVPKNLDLRCAF